MESAFYYQLGLSFLVGSVWITLTTIAAERYGSRIGGFIGGLPSTALVALLFIGVTQTPFVASQATTIMPLAQGFNGLFIIVFVCTVKRGLVFGLGSALIVWFCAASVLVAIDIQQIAVSITGWIVLVITCYLVVEKGMAIPSRGKTDVHYTSSQITLRAVFGGAVIALAVLAGKLGGPVFGGVFATFPAMFVSTLVITHHAGGAEFSRAVAKTLMVSGLINVAIYAIAVRYSYASLGLVYGTAVAVMVSCGTAYLTYLFLRARVS